MKHKSAQHIAAIDAFTGDLLKKVYKSNKNVFQSFLEEEHRVEQEVAKEKENERKRIADLERLETEEKSKNRVPFHKIKQRLVNA